MPIPDTGFMLRSLEYLASFFVIFIGLVFLTIVVVYILDVTQTRQAIRRNYPVVGHFRYFFEAPGRVLPPVFFRHGPRGNALQPRRALLGIPGGQGSGHHDRVRLHAQPLTARDPAVRELRRSRRWARMRRRSAEVTIGPYCKHPMSPLRCSTFPA